jgi:Domain of unknown function (DUF5753)
MPSAPQVGIVMSESALARMVGSEAIMRDQLSYIEDVSRRPNVHLQVLPFRARTFPPACMYSFMMFKIPSPGKSGPLEYVYIEDYDDGRYRDDHESIDTYADLWRRFVGAALDPVRSRELLLRLADSY